MIGLILFLLLITVIIVISIIKFGVGFLSGIIKVIYKLLTSKVFWLLVVFLVICRIMGFL